MTESTLTLCLHQAFQGPCVSSIWPVCLSACLSLCPSVYQCVCLSVIVCDCRVHPNSSESTLVLHLVKNEITLNTCRLIPPGFLSLWFLVSARLWAGVPSASLIFLPREAPEERQHHETAAAVKDLCAALYSVSGVLCVCAFC